MTPARDDADLPNPLPRPPDELARLTQAWTPPAGWRRLFSVNNTDVGLWYIGTSLLFFVLAGALALVMRAQLAWPGNTLVSPALYNQLFTMHGTVMMFLFAVPVVEAIAVFLLPGMLGARDLPFPRLSAYAFWAYAVGALAFFCTIFFGVSPDGGWFMYPPLTGTAQSPGLGADFWLLGIGFIEISAIAGAIELIIGILMTRAPGMTLARMPVYAWAMLVVALMIVFAFPAIIAGTALLEMERAFDWPFFIAERGGDPLLWQHLFWFFGHPEVYIIFLPAAGLVSMMVPVVARTPLVGQRAIVMALVAVGFFSFALWVHHMFTAGLGVMSMALVSAASLAVAVPTSIQVFAWIATLWRGTVRIDATALFLLGFLFIFTLGGLTGVMVAIQPFDWQVHDTYFIVAHLHYVLIGGMVFPVFAALYHWMPLVGGHGLSQRLGRWTFGLMFGGFNLAFFPMHIAGLMGMPRRVYTYAPDLGWTLPNALSTVGAFVFAAGALLCLADVARTWRRPEREAGNPWGAPTLEWLPDGVYGQRSMPEVTSREPLWDRPTLAAEVEAGQHWLPGAATGAREALVTSPVAARPLYLLPLPGDSALPFVAAVGTAGFFLLLTVKLTVLAWGFGLAAVVAMFVWVWQLEAPTSQRLARIGQRAGVPVEVPVGMRGARSHAWWATVIVIAVDASVFASMAFAHVHVSMLAVVCPPPGAALPAGSTSLAAVALLLAGSGAIEWARRHAGDAGRAARWGTAAAVAVALLCTAASFVPIWRGHAAAGLDPVADAWGATVGAMLGYQGLHVVLLVLLGGYWLARAAAGRLGGSVVNTPHVVALMWHWTTLQGLAFVALVHALPGLMD